MDSTEFGRLCTECGQVPNPFDQFNDPPDRNHEDHRQEMRRLTANVSPRTIELGITTDSVESTNDEHTEVQMLTMKMELLKIEKENLQLKLQLAEAMTKTVHKNDTEAKTLKIGL